MLIINLIPEYTNSNTFNSAKVKNEPIDEEFNLLKEKLSQLKEYPDLIVKLLNNKIRECNQVIEKSILNYKDYYSNYIKNNKKIIEYNIKSIY